MKRPFCSYSPLLEDSARCHAWVPFVVFDTHVEWLPRWSFLLIPSLLLLKASVGRFVCESVRGTSMWGTMRRFCEFSCCAFFASLVVMGELQRLADWGMQSSLRVYKR